LKDVLRTLPKFYPAQVEVKYDGFRVQIHRVRDKVKIWSEDGGDVTHRFPSIVKEIKTWRWDVVVDAEITGWTDGYQKGKHLNRADVAGFAHKKGIPKPGEDRFYYANVFDLRYVYPPEGDIHNLPLSERRWHLERKPETEHIKIAEAWIARSEAELENAVRKASCAKG